MSGLLTSHGSYLYRNVARRLERTPSSKGKVDDVTVCLLDLLNLKMLPPKPVSHVVLENG